MPAQRTGGQARTREERLSEIVEWFGRHRGDYCPHDCQHGHAPPKVWSEYFAFLLYVIGCGEPASTGALTADECDQVRALLQERRDGRMAQTGERE